MQVHWYVADFGLLQFESGEQVLAEFLRGETVLVRVLVVAQHGAVDGLAQVHPQLVADARLRMEPH